MGAAQLTAYGPHAAHMATSITSILVITRFRSTCPSMNTNTVMSSVHKVGVKTADGRNW